MLHDGETKVPIIYVTYGIYYSYIMSSKLVLENKNVYLYKSNTERINSKLSNFLYSREYYS